MYKVPPQNKEIESRIIGCILIDSTLVAELFARLVKEDFYYPNNQLIMDLFAELALHDTEIDIATVVDLAKKKGILEKIGKMYLADCVAGVPTTSNLKSYIRVVKEASVRRHGINLAAELSDRMLDQKMNLSELVYELDSKFAQIIRLTNKRDTGSLKTAKAEYLKRKAENKIMNSGIAQLDIDTMGLRPGTIWVLGGMPGAGKSYFALDFALRQCLDGYNTLFFSTELSKAENIRRIANIATQHMNLGFDDAVEEIVKLPNLKLYTDLKTIPEINAEIKFVNNLKKVDLVVVDHLHGIAEDKKTQYDSLNNSLNGLLNVVTDNNLAMLLCSQLSRSSIQSANITQSSFLGTGKIEQIAHCAIILKRVVSDNGTDTENLNLYLVKNRDGRLGTYDAKFNIPYMNILDIKPVNQADFIADL